MLRQSHSEHRKLEVFIAPLFILIYFPSTYFSFWERGPLTAKRCPLSHLPIRPPRVAAARNRSKRLSSPQASAFEHAHLTPIHLRPSSPPLHNASRTRAPASLDKPKQTSPWEVIVLSQNLPAWLRPRASLLRVAVVFVFESAGQLKAA